MMLRVLPSEYHTSEIWVSYSGVVEDLGLLECEIVIWVRVSKYVLQMSKKNYLTSEDQGITILWNVRVGYSGVLESQKVVLKSDK